MSITLTDIRIRLGVPVLQTGSKVIRQDGVGVDTDLVVADQPNLMDKIEAIGFVATGSDSPEYPNSDIIQCYRLNDFNLIVVESEEAFARWQAATFLATYLQLNEKFQRVALFQFITEGHVRDTVIDNPDFPLPLGDCA